MAVEKELSNRQRLSIGALLIVLGLGVSLAIYLHPQQLRAPAWVAYAAASSFVLGGAALIAGALGAAKLVTWLGVLIVLAMLVPFLWVAFGPGPQECGFSLGFISGAGSDWVCRAGFGIGALLGLAVLALILRQAWRQ
jgi:hypothetical protein